MINMNEPGQMEQIDIPIINATLFNQIAEKIDQAVWLRDLSTDQIIYVSPAFETVWGIPCEDLVSDPSTLIQSVHPEDRVIVMSARPDDIRKPLDQTYRIIRPDGGLRWIAIHSFVVRDESKRSLYQVSVAQDITSQNQVDQALRKSLDRSREQFTLSRRMSLARKPEAVLRTLMSAYELRSAHRAALLFFDDPKAGPSHGVDLTATWVSSGSKAPWFSETSLYEEPSFWELIQPSRTVVINGTRTNSRLSPLLRDFLLEGKVHTMVLFPLLTSGEWLGCLVVYYNEDTRFSHIELRHLKVLIDQATITLFNLKLLEVEAESRHEAERANEIKTEFLAMISHELRTPLTSIIGFTTTMLADDVNWEPEEQKDFVQTIQHESFRLQELIDHLLDLSRLDAGRLPIQLKSHSLQEILLEASPQLTVLTNGQQLTTHIPENLPPVFVDDKRIAQVLVNLIRNSATYAPKGTEINISAGVRSNSVQINVNDQGPGIQPSERKRVFQAFRRGVSEETGSAKGAGLGLAICKGLVEAHGGRIWIRKKTSPGTTVSFTVPLVPKQPGDKIGHKE
jgi:PAS domain S-box-containing protein